MNLQELRFARRPLDFLNRHQTCQNRRIEMRARPDTHLLVWQPELVNDLFRSASRVRLAGSSTLEPLVGPSSLLFANGQRHAAYRKVIGRQLRGRQLMSYHETIRKTVESAVHRLAPQTTVNVAEWARGITLRIIAQITFGRADEAFLAYFMAWTNTALGSPQRTLAYRYLRPPIALPSPWRTFLRRRAALAGSIVRGIRDNRYSGLVTTLLGAEPPLADITDDDLVDQVLSLLFAGHETTATALTSALCWLDTDPRLRSDLLDELNASDSDGSTAPDLPLLNALCLETLRISPPAMVAGNRVLLADTALAARQLPAGTRLTPCIYLAHRQPDIYPAPNHFTPERFLDQRLPTHTFFPFGGGTRRCLGADLALLELRMTLAVLLRHRTLRRTGDGPALQVTGPILGFGNTVPMTVCANGKKT